MIELLMATYNGEKFIAEQIESLLNQSFQDFKVLIHDDGSTDKTVQIIKEYVEKYPGKIIFVEDNIKTGGAKNNFQHLLEMSTEKYVMLCDQDDYWEKEKIEKAIEIIKKSEKESDMPILCHGDLKVADGELNIKSMSMFDMQKLDKRKKELRDLLVQNNVTGCTVIMNRALVKKCREMPKEAIMHDWWYGLVAAAFGKVEYIGDAGIKYRQHGNNTEGAKNLKNPIYLLRKLFDRKNVKRTLQETYRQAKAFNEIYGGSMEKEKKEILDAYISMENKGKLKKYRIIKKYGFMKSGMARKLGYILFL